MGTKQTAVEQRWALARMLVESWDVLLGERDRVTAADIRAAEARLGVRLPAGLFEWYRIAGRRQDLVGNGDHWLPPEDLRWIGNVLVFAIENQGVVCWGLHAQQLDLGDPAVLVDLSEYDPEDIQAAEVRYGPAIEYGQIGNTWCIWSDPNTPLSVFTLDMVTLPIFQAAPFTADGRVPPEILAVIHAHYNCWRQADGQFPHLYGDGDTLIQWESGEDRPFLSVAARTRAAFDRFQQVIGSPRMRCQHRSRYSEHQYSEMCVDVSPS